MGKDKTKNNAVNSSETSKVTSSYGDSADTNRPQAEEKDLQDLLKDIELQYEQEEEVRRIKKGRKKRRKVDEEEEKAEGQDEPSKAAPPPPDDVEPVKAKGGKRAQKAMQRAQKVAGEGGPAIEGDRAPWHSASADQADRGDLVEPQQAKPEDVRTQQPVKKAGKVPVPAAASKKSAAKARQIEMIKQALAKQKEMEEQMAREEEERIRREENLERLLEEKLEQERLRKQRRRDREKARIQRKKESGTYLTKEQKEKKDRALLQLKMAGVLPTGEGEVTKPASRRAKRQAKETKGTDDNQANQIETGEVPVALTPDKGEPIAEPFDDIKECWDDESEDEKAPTLTKQETQGSAKATPASRPATRKDYESSSEKGSESTDSGLSESEDEDIRSLPARERALARIQRRRELAESRIDMSDLRCPVICVMGHVDTGKTKMLDNLRRTHVQDGEAGGITQQIGATNVPQSTILERTRHCARSRIRLPGFIFVDTPGHESFKNLRVRGSSLCDIAILIVDIMHGVEPQTVESISLLKARKCPFIIALNKIDRLNGWKSNATMPVERLITEHQEVFTMNDFERRYKQAIAELAQQHINAALFYNNPDPRTFYPMVPVSAVTGDGVGDLMYAIVDVCQNALAPKLAFSEELKCTVMEVKSIEGFGTTIDICLVNGRLRVGDTIVVPGQEGPIVTNIRGLLMPAVNKDLRVKNQYQIYKEVKGSRGVKVAARNLEKAMAGLPLYVAEKEDEIEILQEDLRGQLKSVLSSFETQEQGVYVQASTLGSLEALLAFLNTSKIPFSGLNIGPVHRLDVTRASVMLEKDSQWAVILAFDVRIEHEAQEVADKTGVKIFSADIIYHLFDKFMAYRDELKAQNKEKHKHLAVFPCTVKMLPQYVFNTRDPIVVGVLVERGFLKVGTPLCVAKDGTEPPVDVGRVSSIEFNHKAIDTARANQEVCIKIEPMPGETPRMIGRHFELTDPLISKISRESIDAVKNFFRDEMQKADWQLVIDLKQKLKII